jgi:DNA-binding transcriptional MocR family regulator
MARRDATVDALADLMPRSTWNIPSGGFYVWVGLPAGLDAKAMLPRAVTERVAYVPGTAFFADGQGRTHLRLSYCYPTPERIREGIRRLAGVIDEELEVVDTFGGQDAVDGPVQGSAAGSAGIDSPTPDLA